MFSLLLRIFNYHFCCLLLVIEINAVIFQWSLLTQNRCWNQSVADLISACHIQNVIFSEYMNILRSCCLNLPQADYSVQLCPDNKEIFWNRHPLVFFSFVNVFFHGKRHWNVWARHNFATNSTTCELFLWVSWPKSSIRNSASQINEVITHQVESEH